MTPAELRDRFFSRTERDQLRAAVLDTHAEPTASLQGLPLCHHPTARFRAVRFLEAKRLPEALLPLFARPVPRMPELVAVFVDPYELSLRTFENIVPLDRLHAHLPSGLALTDRVGRGEEVYTFAATAPDALRQALLELDALGLYVPPLNPGDRGGQRFIFHSARLSELLNEALRGALPEGLLPGFSHVNPVFRCNRFQPGDEPFRAHLDSPYSDPARRHYSRYTLLWYLTGGTGAPALRLEELELQTLDAMQIVMFHQRLEHTGAPFSQGDKVFLRTELVYEERDHEYEPSIAQLFSKACYLVHEGLFSAELARASHDYFDRAARAHWQGPRASERTGPSLHKSYGGVHFLANGYDYWFPKGPISLQECAVVTLLDYFHVRRAELVEVRHSADPSFLDQHRDPLPEPLFAQIRRDLLFPEPAYPHEERLSCPDCTPEDFHRPKLPFDPFRNEDIYDAYVSAQAVARDKLDAPILLMGAEVYLDQVYFVVRDRQIHVLYHESLAPLHFAGHLCWRTAQPEDFLTEEVGVEALCPLVPPILFAESERGWHLMFDFFRNGWMVRCERERVSIPRITVR